MTAERRRSTTALAALALSVICLVGASAIASGPLAVFGGVSLMIALLALNKVPRDPGW